MSLDTSCLESKLQTLPESASTTPGCGPTSAGEHSAQAELEIFALDVSRPGVSFWDSPGLKVLLMRLEDDAPLRLRLVCEELCHARLSGRDSQDELEPLAMPKRVQPSSCNQLPFRK